MHSFYYIKNNSIITIGSWLSIFFIFQMLKPAVVKADDLSGIQAPKPTLPLAPTPIPSAIPYPRTLPGLPSSPQLPKDNLPKNLQAVFKIKKFVFVGSTVFTQQELENTTKFLLNREISFGELLQARAVITKYYQDAGYATSGAYIPPQSIKNGIVTIQIVEGSLEKINIKMQGRLSSGYIRSRLEIATKPPLNIPNLVQALQMLKLDPLVDSISAELAAGVNPQKSILDITVKAAPSESAMLLIDNGRSPSLGSFRRGIELQERDLTGFGDALSANFYNTQGSNDWTFSYNIPVNPYNGTINLYYRNFRGVVIQKPFNSLDLVTTYQDYKITYRQPIIQTPTTEFAAGLIFDYQTSQNFIFNNLPLPSYGSNLNGLYQVPTLRFFQELTFKSAQSVLAGRSELSIGINGLGSTRPYDTNFNVNAPQQNYFIWRAQGQWVQLLAPDTLLVAQTSLQIANSPLVPVEQFAIGGLGSVEGYPQNYLSTDNGIFGSIEVRLPILRMPKQKTLLQIVPFIDIGSGWNDDGRSTVSSTLLSAGIGLLWQQGANFNARIDYGIPLKYVPRYGNSLNADGILFSVNWKAF